MNEGNESHLTVGRSLEIDQRAVKIFLSWLPDNWLPRKQDPDLFVDYRVELVEAGKPTGLHFSAQLKGFDDDRNKRPLSYPFKVKHLKYYRDQCRDPIVLFLINVSNGEGYWHFVQKHLKEQVSSKILDSQQTLSVLFSKEDNLHNLSKFRCLLPAAEKFVRNLHPGSIKAASQKLKSDLEMIDPRCSVSFSLKDGKEYVEISFKEEFTFTTKIMTKNLQGLKDFWERGTKLILEKGDIEITGAPILEEAISSSESVEIQFGVEQPGAIHLISRADIGTIIPVSGYFRAGTKFANFHGQLGNSPLEISLEMSAQAIEKGEPIDMSVMFSAAKWAGQRIRFLPYFDQVVSATRALTAEVNPLLEIYIAGNILMKVEMEGRQIDVLCKISDSIEWFKKCRWLAQHFNVNPILPDFSQLSIEAMGTVDGVYDLITKRRLTVDSPNIQIPCFASTWTSEEKIKTSDRVFRIEYEHQTVDFLGTPVRLDKISHVYTNMDLSSQSVAPNGEIRVVFTGTENTMRTSYLM